MSEEHARAVELHQRALSSFMASSRGGEVHDEPDMLLYVGGSDVSWTNGVQMATLRDAEAEQRIADVVDALRTRAVPGTWWVGPSSRPTDLSERLIRAGFHLEEDMPWMTMPMDASDPVPVPDVAGLRIERVGDAPGHRQFLEAMERGFGLPSNVRALLDESGAALGYAPDARWVRFVGWMDGRVVASSGLMHFAGVVGIYNVTTIVRYRRRGIGAAMTMAAAEHGRTLGYRLAALGASPMGIRLYRRLGFREVCVLRLFAFTP